MDPTDLLPNPPLTFGGLPIRSTPASELDPTDLMARLLAAYPSQVFEGWSPPPPSQEAAANADPITQLGLAQLYPDLFGHLGPSGRSQELQDQDADGSLLPAQQSAALQLGSAPAFAQPSTSTSLPDDQSLAANGLNGSRDPAADTSGNPVTAQGQASSEADDSDQQANQAPDPSGQVLPPQPLQLGPIEFAAAPRLANVSDKGLEFEPTYLDVPGALGLGRIGLQRDVSGFQSLGGLADPAHATPAGQIIKDGLTPTAAVNLGSFSPDELSLKPVVQDGRLQMAVYDDTTRERWVLDSTPGQSATLYNARHEPIYFSTTDLTGGAGGSGNNPIAGLVRGLRDSGADQNTFSLRPDGGVWSMPNLGYQESKIEGALNLGALGKDLVLLGGSKFIPAIAGAGKAGEDVSLTGPVIFRHPPNATAEEMEQVRAYVENANQALKEGRLSPTGRVAVTRAMRRTANKLAREERNRAAEAGVPYKGVVGHGPDMTWTGKPDFYRPIDMHPRVNSSLGAQSRWYPRGFKPTGFQVEGE